MANKNMSNGSAFDALFTSTVGTDQPPASSTATTQASFTFAQDWAAYHAHRPEYPAKLYDMLFTYHETHSSRRRSSDDRKATESPAPDLSSFDRALDLGTGGGVVATTLLSCFSHVVALDPSSHHLSSAGKLLRVVVEQQAREQNKGVSAADAQPLASFEDRVTLVTGYGEDLLSHVEAQSVDMITVAEAVHWMKYQQVIDAAAEALRPGGTFAAWWYSPWMRVADDSEAFSKIEAGDSIDADRKIKLQRAASALVNVFEFFARLVAPKVGHGNLYRASAMCNAGLRCLAFDPAQWELGVQRHEWVRQDEWARLSGFEATPDESNVRETDMLFEYLCGPNAGSEERASIIRKEAANLDWIKGYFANLWQDVYFNDNEQAQVLYRELGGALDSLGGKVTLIWPFLLVMATKK